MGVLKFSIILVFLLHEPIWSLANSTELEDEESCIAAGAVRPPLAKLETMLGKYQYATNIEEVVEKQLNLLQNFITDHSTDDCPTTANQQLVHALPMRLKALSPW